MTQAEESGVTSRADRRGDLIVMLVASGVLLLTFSVGASVQNLILIQSDTQGKLDFLLPRTGIRLTTNLASTAALLVFCWLVRLNELRLPWQVVAVAIGAVSASFLRYALQASLGLYAEPFQGPYLGEVGLVAAVGIVSLTLGLIQVFFRRRLREQERAGARQEIRAAEALAALTGEELRVRREVAESLHGTLQGRLVFVLAKINAILKHWDGAQAAPVDIEALRSVREDVDMIRERDVRELSKLLYPTGVDLGVAHAVRVIAGQIPAVIETDVVIDPRLGSAAAPDDLDPAQRIVLVRGAEEGVVNALRHGNATWIRIELALWDSTEGSGVVRLLVDDNGRGAEQGTLTFRGLTGLADRARALGGSLTLRSSEYGGVRLSIEFPLG